MATRTATRPAKAARKPKTGIAKTRTKAKTVTKAKAKTATKARTKTTPRLQAQPLRTLTRAEKTMRTQPVAVRIRHARMAVGLTQAKLASLLGITRVQVVHWESGPRYRPSARYRQKLAKATGYPIQFFEHDGPGGAAA